MTDQNIDARALLHSVAGESHRLQAERIDALLREQAILYAELEQLSAEREQLVIRAGEVERKYTEMLEKVISRNLLTREGEASIPLIAAPEAREPADGEVEEVAALKAMISHAKEKEARLQRELDDARDEIRDITGSTSWRITAPLRALSQWYKK